MPDWPLLHEEPGCCTDADCGLPAGFFRVRYFNNKPMRLADYVDEQQYHRGKMRFHNERLHGAGILCGLKVSATREDGMLLRVARGAAIDDCGREIIVGWDHCVDVAAWFAEQGHLARSDGRKLCKPDENRRVSVCVLLRHAECAGGPEPAPRSRCTTPGCGCGGTGKGGDCGCGGGTSTACGDKVEYGRVTEEFELRLAFAEEARHLSRHLLFPPADVIDEAVGRTIGAIGLLHGLAEPIRRGCPGGGEGWLLLACFDLVMDKTDDDKVVGLADIDHHCASQVLLSTQVLQYLLAGLWAEVDPGLGGPEIRAVHFRAKDAQAWQFVLELTAAIEGASVDEDSSFALRRLAATGWDEPASRVVTAFYKPGRTDPSDFDGPAIYVDVRNEQGNAFLVDGGLYQLYAPADVDPVVDALLRPLRPRQLLWRFRMAKDEQGALQMRPLGQGGGHG